MHGLQGRPEVTPTVDEVRELSREEVRATPRADVPRVKKLRDSHHMVARLTAMGLTLTEVAEQAGYSINGVSTLQKDPSFKELVAHYREVLTEEWKGAVDEYFQNLVGVRNKALRLISDKLGEAEVGEIPLNQLQIIAADAADRTGYPKRKETVNLNLDFADKLDRATQRSRQAKTINATALPSPEVPPSATPVAPSGSSPVDGAEQAAEVQGSQPRPPSFPKELLPEPRLKRRA